MGILKAEYGFGVASSFAFRVWGRVAFEGYLLGLLRRLKEFRLTNLLSGPKP